jgi:hypothetical protein
MFAVNVVGWPDPGAMSRIGTCCDRFVEIRSDPAVSTCLAFLALSCSWRYTEPGEAAVRDPVQSCMSEGVTDERLMVVKQVEAVRIAAESQRTP